MDTRNGSLNDSLAESLLQVNSMLYKMAPEINIVSKRSHVTDFAQQSSYSNGETIVWDTQTGALYAKGKQSYMVFKVTTVGGAGDFGSGSSANLFNRIVVRHKTGKEWCRLEDANLITKFLQKYKCDDNYFAKLGISQGYPTGAGGSGSEGDLTGDLTGGYVYVLPMNVIPCFEQDKLLPPQALSGCRIELSTENVSTAIGGAGPVTSYTISNPVIKWDTFELADQFARKVSEIASSKGLNLLHKEYFHTTVANTATQFNFDIKKACSKALKCMVVSRVSSQIALASVDSMASEGFTYTKFQAHIGSQYYPNSPLEVDGVSAEDINEMYYYTCNAMDGQDGPCYNNGSVSAADYLTFEAMIAIDLNKSNVSGMAGEVLNNSRALLWDITFNTSVARQLDVWLQHLRAAKFYLSNVEVKD